eukprot:1961020-Rhodomonas_salina.2
MVLEQTANAGSQSCSPAASHSLMSSHDRPKPALVSAYPGLQVHVKLPLPFVQSDSTAQPVTAMPKLHSSTSSHSTPSPLHPTWQAQANEPVLSAQSASV